MALDNHAAFRYGSWNGSRDHTARRRIAATKGAPASTGPLDNAACILHNTVMAITPHNPKGNTMPDTRTMTIAGINFEVSTPYAEGHTVNAAEAKVLNQTRAENISNATRAKIKELASEDGSYTDDAVKQAAALVAEYDSSYVFTLGNAGGGRTAKDPIQKEAESLAKAAITASLKAQGRTMKQVKEENPEGLANKIAEVAENPEILKQAKARVAARNKTIDSLDIEL